MTFDIERLNQMSPPRKLMGMDQLSIIAMVSFINIQSAPGPKFQILTASLKSPCLERVKIKIVISLVTTSGNIDFDFTEKSQYFIGKHIRNVNFGHITCSESWICSTITKPQSKTGPCRTFVSKYTWAIAWQNQQNDMCPQLQLRLVWASAQCDQRLRCALNG